MRPPRCPRPLGSLLVTATRELFANGQDSHSRARLVHNHDRTAFELVRVLAQRSYYRVLEMRRAYVLGAHLKDTRSRGTRESEDRCDVEVVREDDVTVLTRSLEDLLVCRPGIAHGRPV